MSFGIHIVCTSARAKHRLYIAGTHGIMERGEMYSLHTAWRPISPVSFASYRKEHAKENIAILQINAVKCFDKDFAYNAHTQQKKNERV